MSLQNKVFIFQSDAGHGWMAVKRKDLVDLKIAHQITSHSYQRGQTVYLEEDQDVSTFFAAFEKKYGSKPRIKEGKNYDGHCPIRYYDRYRCGLHEVSFLTIVKVG